MKIGDLLLLLMVVSISTLSASAQQLVSRSRATTLPSPVTSNISTLYANDPIAYFDWNDVVLNLLAALGGLVLLPQENVRKVPTKRILAAAGAWTLGMSLLVFLLNPDPYLMRSQKTDSFWLVSSVKTHYHVLTATEGTILLGVVWIVTAGLYWPDRSRAPAIPLLAEEGWMRRAKRRRRRGGAKREPDRAKPQ